MDLRVGVDNVSSYEGLGSMPGKINFFERIPFPSPFSEYARAHALLPGGQDPAIYHIIAKIPRASIGSASVT